MENQKSGNKLPNSSNQNNSEIPSNDSPNVINIDPSLQNNEGESFHPRTALANNTTLGSSSSLTSNGSHSQSESTSPFNISRSTSKSKLKGIAQKVRFPKDNNPKSSVVHLPTDEMSIDGTQDKDWRLDNGFTLSKESPHAIHHTHNRHHHNVSIDDEDEDEDDDDGVLQMKPAKPIAASRSRRGSVFPVGSSTVVDPRTGTTTTATPGVLNDIIKRNSNFDSSQSQNNQQQDMDLGLNSRVGLSNDLGQEEDDELMPPTPLVEHEITEKSTITSQQPSSSSSNISIPNHSLPSSSFNSKHTSQPNLTIPGGHVSSESSTYDERPTISRNPSAQALLVNTDKGKTISNTDPALILSSPQGSTTPFFYNTNEFVPSRPTSIFNFLDSQGNETGEVLGNSNNVNDDMTADLSSSSQLISQENPPYSHQFHQFHRNQTSIAPDVLNTSLATSQVSPNYFDVGLITSGGLAPGATSGSSDQRLTNNSNMDYNNTTNNNILSSAPRRPPSTHNSSTNLHRSLARMTADSYLTGGTGFGSGVNSPSLINTNATNSPLLKSHNRSSSGNSIAFLSLNNNSFSNSSSETTSPKASRSVSQANIKGNSSVNSGENTGAFSFLKTPKSLFQAFSSNSKTNYSNKSDSLNQKQKGKNTFDSLSNLESGNGPYGNETQNGDIPLIELHERLAQLAHQNMKNNTTITSTDANVTEPLSFSPNHVSDFSRNTRNTNQASSSNGSNTHHHNHNDGHEFEDHDEYMTSKQVAAELAATLVRAHSKHHYKNKTSGSFHSPPISKNTFANDKHHHHAYHNSTGSVGIGNAPSRSNSSTNLLQNYSRAASPSPLAPQQQFLDRPDSSFSLAGSKSRNSSMVAIPTAAIFDDMQQHKSQDSSSSSERKNPGSGNTNDVVSNTKPNRPGQPFATQQRNTGKDQQRPPISRSSSNTFIVGASSSSSSSSISPSATMSNIHAERNKNENGGMFSEWKKIRGAIANKASEVLSSNPYGFEVDGSSKNINGIDKNKNNNNNNHHVDSENRKNFTTTNNSNHISNRHENENENGGTNVSNINLNNPQKEKPRIPTSSSSPPSQSSSTRRASNDGTQTPHYGSEDYVPQPKQVRQGILGSLLKLYNQQQQQQESQDSINGSSANVGGALTPEDPFSNSHAIGSGTVTPTGNGSAGGGGGGGGARSPLLKSLSSSFENVMLAGGVSSGSKNKNKSTTAAAGGGEASVQGHKKKWSMGLRNSLSNSASTSSLAELVKSSNALMGVKHGRSSMESVVSGGLLGFGSRPGSPGPTTPPSSMTPGGGGNAGGAGGAAGPSGSGTLPSRPKYTRQHSALEAIRKAQNERKRRKKFEEEELRITLHIADVLQRQRFTLRLCRALMMYGAPTHRLEEYMTMTSRVLGIDGQFIYIPGCMIASFGDSTTHTSEMQLVRVVQGVNLSKLHAVHQIYKNVIHAHTKLDVASEQIDDLLLRRKNLYPTWLVLLIFAISSAAVGPFGFGAKWLDMPICFLIGGSVGVLQIVVAPRSGLYNNVFEVTASIIVSFLGRAFGSIGSNSEYFCFPAIVQSSLALILPGYIICKLYS